MQGRASPRVTRRWLVFGGGGALAGGALAACDGGPGGQPPAANRPPVRLLFMSWRPIAMDQFAPAWKEYEQRHNATIEVDPSGDGNQEKITTMFAAETGPDLFDSNTRSLPRMYDSGFVLEVTKHLT